MNRKAVLTIIIGLLGVSILTPGPGMGDVCWSEPPQLGGVKFLSDWNVGTGEVTVVANDLDITGTFDTVVFWFAFTDTGTPCSFEGTPTLQVDVWFDGEGGLPGEAYISMVPPLTREYVGCWNDAPVYKFTGYTGEIPITPGHYWFDPFFYFDGGVVRSWDLAAQSVTAHESCTRTGFDTPWVPLSQIYGAPYDVAQEVIRTTGPCNPPSPTTNTTWGTIKALYRD